MAYGLRVVGGNSILQLDTDTPELTGLGVAQVGVGSSVSYSLGDFVFVSYPTIGSAAYHIVTVVTTPGTMTFKSFNTATRGVSNLSMNYCVLRPMTGITPTGDFGLLLRNSSLQTTFDSRASADEFSVYIKSIAIQGSQTGSVGLSSTPITTSFSDYFCANGLFFVDAGSESHVSGMLITNGISWWPNGIHYYSSYYLPLEGPVSGANPHDIVIASQMP